MGSRAGRCRRRLIVMIRRRVLGAAMAVVMTAGCGGDDDVSRPPADTARSEVSVVEFRYLDSSVPPQYHRSWTLTIEPDQVHVVVDSYGTVLADVHRPLPEGLWSKLGPVPESSFTADAGCTGGTARVVRITEGGDTREAVVESCGGQGAEAAEALDAWVAPVVAAIEDWETLKAEDADPSTFTPITD